MANTFYTIPTNKNIIQPTSYENPRQPEAFSATFADRGYNLAQTPEQRAHRRAQTSQAPIDNARSAVDAVYASRAPATSNEVRLTPEQTNAYIAYVMNIGKLKTSFIAKETGSLN